MADVIMEIHVDKKECCRIVGGREIEEAAALLAGENEVYMVFDRNAADIADRVAARTPGLRRSFVFDAFEETKSIQAALSLNSLLLEAGASRDALLVAVGGGITTDLTGFSASIYKRGIRYANIPTTLLAQVDAAIGGKTGVNFGDCKNMLGVIAQPQWTFLCPETLLTLPRRDFLSGAAEVLKTFLLGGREDLYTRTVDLLRKMQDAADGASWEDLLRNNLAAWQEIITAAAEIKAGVVERDPFEQGERRILNLGHTFAHAIESLQLSRPRHGCCHGHGACHSGADGHGCHEDAPHDGCCHDGADSHGCHEDGQHDGCCHGDAGGDGRGETGDHGCHNDGEDGNGHKGCCHKDASHDGCCHGEADYPAGEANERCCHGDAGGDGRGETGDHGCHNDGPHKGCCHDGDGEGRAKNVPLTHGEAVAIGILMAARLAERLGKAEKGLAARLEADFSAAGLPTTCPVAAESLQDAMEKDKKAADSRIRFILPTTIGQVAEQPLSAAEAIALLSD